MLPTVPLNSLHKLGSSEQPVGSLPGPPGAPDPGMAGSFSWESLKASMGEIIDRLSRLTRGASPSFQGPERGGYLGGARDFPEPGPGREDEREGPGLSPLEGGQGPRPSSFFCRSLSLRASASGRSCRIREGDRGRRGVQCVSAAAAQSAFESVLWGPRGTCRVRKRVRVGRGRKATRRRAEWRGGTGARKRRGLERPGAHGVGFRGGQVSGVDKEVGSQVRPRCSAGPGD